MFVYNLTREMNFFWSLLVIHLFKFMHSNICQMPTSGYNVKKPDFSGFPGEAVVDERDGL